MKWFSDELQVLAKYLKTKLPTIQPREILHEHRNKAKFFFICGKLVDKIIYDHDHFTKTVLGFSHNSCNLNLKKQFNIPVIFHKIVI